MMYSAGYEREEYVTVDGARLWTATTGSGVPLLLCHGGPGACDNLAPVAAMVDDLVMVHRYDQRSCGRSDRSASNRLASYIADIEALRICWGHERWIVGGHSWGTSLTLAYAMTYPERVAGLVLLCTTGLNGIGEEYRREWRSRLSADELDLHDRLRKRRTASSGEDLSIIATHMMQIKFKTDLADPDTALGLPTYDCPMNFDVNHDLSSDWAMFVQGPGIESRVEMLMVPALIVAGADDPRSAEGAYQLAALLPTARLAVLSEVGHYPWLEHPDLLRSELREFLAGAFC